MHIDHPHPDALFGKNTGSLKGFPGAEGAGRTPCPGSPAIKDLFKQLGGLVLYAIDTLFMPRPRTWNLHTLCPADATFTRSGRVERRAGCPICGGDPPST